MLIASNKGAGMNMGFPDVCLTPAGPAVVPIPYPNIGMNAQATTFALKVMIKGMNALNLSTMIAMTNGDQAGVAHWSFMGMAMFTKGDMKTFFEGLPGVTLTSMGIANKGNCPMSLAAVPSVSNVFLTQRSSAPSRLMTGYEQVAHALPAQSADVETTSRGDVVVIELSSFGLDVPAKVFNALRTSPRGVVFDLRGNPGGDLDVMLELADDFLPRGTPMLNVRFDDGDCDERHARSSRHYEMPLAVLVDENTASAAELFAGIMRCAGRAAIVGSRTHGKGTVQRFNPMPYGDRRELSDVATCVLPDGSQPPVQPDVEGGLERAMSSLVLESHRTSP